MKRVLQVGALLVAFALPAFCQYSRLSNHDQHEFDEAYNKWVKDTRKNDRDDIRRDERKMQNIMQRNNIPSDVPFDRIATNGNRYENDRDRYNGQGQYDNNQGQYDNSQRQYDNDQRRDQDRDRAYYENNSPRLSSDDQREFDQVYSKWVDDIRRNDRDDVRKDERRMQDIMARYNIPSDVPYDRIVSPNVDHR